MRCSALFTTGEVSAQDKSGLDSLTQEEQIGAAAALSSLALLLIILGVIALVVVIVLIVAATTGALVYKKRMYDLSNQALEGEIVSQRSIPVGSEIAAPSWAKESGGDGINPMGNMRSGPNEIEMGSVRTSLTGADATGNAKFASDAVQDGI
jgi:hypothetical protein